MTPAIRTILFGAAPFTLAQLFRNGEPGAWFDKDDLSTMYQDSAGTTPAYAPGQGSADCPIGLWLDKSLGVTVGPERVSNGGFDSSTGWTPGDGTMAISGGALAFTNTPNAVSITGTGATSAPAAGMWLRASLNLVSLTAGAVRVIYAGSVAATFSTAGQKVVYFQAASAANIPTLQAIGSTTAVVDSFSIVQIAGSHASQSTANSRPTDTARKNLLLGTDALATQSVTTIAAPYVLSFWGTGTVTLSGTSTAGPLVGTGTSNRVSLTFTPTAGSLTLTVSGSVTQAQLEFAS
jgi:hypothetical protein